MVGNNYGQSRGKSFGVYILIFMLLLYGIFLQLKSLDIGYSFYI